MNSFLIGSRLFLNGFEVETYPYGIFLLNLMIWSKTSRKGPSKHDVGERPMTYISVITHSTFKNSALCLSVPCLGLIIGDHYLNSRALANTVCRHPIIDLFSMLCCWPYVTLKCLIIAFLFLNYFYPNTADSLFAVEKK